MDSEEDAETYVALRTAAVSTYGDVLCTTAQRSEQDENPNDSKYDVHVLLIKVRPKNR